MKHLTLAVSLFVSLCAFARLGDKTLVSWAAPLHDVPQGGSALTLETSNDAFDAIVYGELRKDVWMAGSESWHRTRKDQAADPAETSNPCDFVQIAITYRGREITIYRNAQQLVRYTAANDPVTFGDETLALFGKRHQAAVTGGTFIGRIRDARVYDGALDAVELATLRPCRESARQPWAWWSFGTSGTYERTGRFRVNQLFGGAKVENGALVLAKQGDAFLAAVSRLPGQETKPAPQINANEIMLVAREKMRADPSRPKYHFVIDGNGNPGDSNGAFYHNGKYHLMFLYKRADGYRWGHSVSSDALHWRQVPDAIGPEACQPGGCYSGGGFIDDDGTAYLTYWMLWGERGLGIARSTDPDCTIFKTLAENPVVKSTSWGWTRVVQDGVEQIYASADPSNIWKKDGKYYMLAGNLCLLNDLGRKPDSPEKYKGDVASLFESADLRSWRYLHPFYQRRIAESRATGWTDPDEDCMCPSFLPLPRAATGGAPSDKHLLLFISHNRGCQYYIGRYDTSADVFLPESHGRMTWNDKSYFAPEALIDGQGRQIVWTWLLDNKNGDYERYGWSGVYGLPRSVWLAADGTLGIAPIDELKTLRTQARTWENLNLAAGAGQALGGFPGDCCELEIEVPHAQVANLRLDVRGSADWSQATTIQFDPNASALKVCGDASGAMSINSFCAHVATESAPFELRPGEPLRLRVYIDAAVLDVFANDRQAITRRVYPDAASTGVRLRAVGGALAATVRAWEIAPTNPH